MRPPWEWPWPSVLLAETTAWPVALVLGGIALVLVTWGVSLWHNAFRRCGRRFWRDFAHWLGAAMLGESTLYLMLLISVLRDGERVPVWADGLFVMIGIPFVVAFALWVRAERAA